MVKTDSKHLNPSGLTTSSPQMGTCNLIESSQYWALVAPRTSMAPKALQMTSDGYKTYANGFRRSKIPKIKKKNSSKTAFPSQSYGHLKFLQSAPRKTPANCSWRPDKPANFGSPLIPPPNPDLTAGFNCFFNAHVNAFILTAVFLGLRADWWLVFWPTVLGIRSYGMGVGRLVAGPLHFPPKNILKFKWRLVCYPNTNHLIGPTIRCLVVEREVMGSNLTATKILKCAHTCLLASSWATWQPPSLPRDNL